MAVKPKGLLIDISLCIGCHSCSEGCKNVNNLPPEIAEDLDGDTWTVVYDKGEDRYARNLCRHCVDPACVSVCPVSALTKHAEGPVTWDKNRCLGCRYCMIGCPFRIPRFEWNSNTPRIRKCILCEPRLKEGKSTGCAEACPTEATVFGDRETLVKMAEERIKANPDRYYDHIYGLEEVGGTSVLFLSPVPFEEIDFDTTVAKYPMPDLTWRVLMHVPNILLLGGGFLGSSYWLFKRRVAVAQAQADAAAKKAQNKADNKEANND